MNCSVFGFASESGPSECLAQALGLPHHRVGVRSFPDGESLVTVEMSPATALLYRSLDHPNHKIVEILLAAAALRENGATKIILIAPYIAYMRQDIAFRPGEAVSQRVIGQLLAGHFDALLTIDPHLHRTHSLSAVMPGIDAVSVSAAELLAATLDADDSLLVGPDGEARQWVERIANTRGLEFILGRKHRNGDRNVQLAIPDAERAHGRRVVIVDDLISSGTTLAAAAKLLRDAGAMRIEVLATHCLAGEADLEKLRHVGISTIQATDSVFSPVGILPIAALLADAIRHHGWCT